MALCRSVTLTMMLHVEVIPAVNPGIKAPLSEAECSGVCRLHEKGVGRGWVEGGEGAEVVCGQNQVPGFITSTS